MLLTVHLFAHPGRVGALRAYEEKALEIFRRHGGEVVAAFVPAPGPPGAAWPDEIHVLRIADRGRLEGFLADPDRLALGPERDAALRRADTYLAAEDIAYGKEAAAGA